MPERQGKEWWDQRLLDRRPPCATASFGGRTCRTFATATIITASRNGTTSGRTLCPAHHRAQSVRRRRHYPGGVGSCSQYRFISTGGSYESDNSSCQNRLSYRRPLGRGVFGAPGR